MWLLLAPAAVIGAALWELVVRPATKSEVVQFTTNAKLIDVNTRALDGAGISYEVSTDGVNSWIMVKPADRTNAVQAVLNSAKAAGLMPT